MSIATTQKRGEALQAELQRFFALITTSGGGNFGQFADLKRELDKLHQEGWRLTMSSKLAPADKAGIDFVWSNACGWFPLDAKAVGMPCSSLVQLVPVAENKAVGECSRLCFEDKKAFLELLVNLARRGEPIKHDVLAVPKLSDVAGPQLLEELKSFQRALNAASQKTQDMRYRQWAETLKRAIGYALSQIRPAGHNVVAEELVQSVVAESLNRFLAEFFDPAKPRLEVCMHQRTNLNRSRQLCYLVSEDSLKVAAGSPGHLVVLAELSRVVTRRFLEAYGEVLKQHSCAEWVMTRRRFFENRGVECAIDFILDALQSRNRELSRAAA